MAKNSRAAALKIVREVNEGAYLNLAVKKELSGLEEADKRFVTALCHTLFENRIKIDFVIDSFTKGKRVHSLIYDILRIGVCQLLFFDSVPESAAVNECVKLAADSKKPQLKGFVNGVLRNIARNKNNIEFPGKDDGAVKYLSVNYSYPEWLTEKYIRDFGEEFTEELFAYKKTAAETCVKYNSLKLTDDKLKEKLLGAAFKVRRGNYLSYALYIKNVTSIDELKMFKKGEFSVQSESSMLVCEAADIKEGLSVIDVCAAPGGKAAFAYERSKREVTALELHSHRAELMKKNFERLGTQAKITVANAEVPIPEYYGKFDRVLVDAPCSAMGLLYRKPDIKLKKTPDELKKIVKTQLEILKTASRYVARGGRLIYSTCTIDKDENEGIIDCFLNEERGFKAAELSLYMPEAFKKRAQEGRLTLYPHIDGIDGFFIAALERK